MTFPVFTNSSGVVPQSYGTIIYPGQVCVYIGQNQWILYTSAVASTYIGYTLGLSLTTSPPGNPITVQEFGAVPVDVVNAGAGGEQCVVATSNGGIGRGNSGQIIGITDPAGQVLMFPSRIGSQLSILANYAAIGTPGNNQVPVFSTVTNTWGFSATPGVVTAYAADLVNSLPSQQFVSSLSYNATGFAHGAGGNIAVNGSGTLLNWVDSQVVLAFTGTSLLQLGKTSTDFVYLGASTATQLTPGSLTTTSGAMSVDAAAHLLLGPTAATAVYVGNSTTGTEIRSVAATGHNGITGYIGATQVYSLNEAVGDFIYLGASTGTQLTPGSLTNTAGAMAVDAAAHLVLGTSTATAVLIGNGTTTSEVRFIAEASSTGITGFAGGTQIFGLNAVIGDYIAFGTAPPTAGFIRATIGASGTTIVEGKYSGTNFAILATDSSQDVALGAPSGSTVGFYVNGTSVYVCSSTVASLNVPTLQWTVGNTPAITQAIQSSDSAAHNMSISAQSAELAAVTNLTGGNLTLSSGAGSTAAGGTSGNITLSTPAATTTAGSVILSVGATAVVTCASSLVTVAQPLTVTSIVSMGATQINWNGVNHGGNSASAATASFNWLVTSGGSAVSVTGATVVLSNAQASTPVIALTGTVHTGGCAITLPNNLGAMWYFDFTGVTFSSQTVTFTTGSGTTAGVSSLKAAGYNMVIVSIPANHVVSIG